MVTKEEKQAIYTEMAKPAPRPALPSNPQRRTTLLRLLGLPANLGELAMGGGDARG